MICVDMSHLLMRNLYMNMKDIYNKETGEFSEGYFAHVIVQNVLSFARDFGASETNPVIVATDARPSWRHDYYIENCKKFGEYDNMTYKGHRVKDDSLPWDKIWETYAAVLEGLEECSDFVVLEVDKAEGDDIIAVLARENAKRGNKSFVISSDKDFRQLQSKDIIIYDPIKKIIIPDDDQQIGLKVKIMTGDGGDNIKAIRQRIGPKTAIKLLPEIDDMLKTDSDLRAKFEFNRNLIDFDCIPEYVKENIKSEFSRKHFKFCPTRALLFCSKFNMQKIGARYLEFKMKPGPFKTKLNSQSKGASEVADATIESFFG